MRQRELVLTEEDRVELEKFRKSGVHNAREINRAHVLIALDGKVSENEIMRVLGIGRTAIWRTRSAYLDGGLEAALYDSPRPGKPPKYRTDDEAYIAALACSTPPKGAKRWTVALLTEEARKQPDTAHISRETIRRILKKTASNRGGN